MCSDGQFLAVFHNTEPRDRTDYNHVSLFWRFYGVATIWCKKWLLPFYLWNYPIESNFQKFCFKNLTIFQGFRQSYNTPGPFRAILSFCFRGPWLKISSRKCNKQVLGWGWYRKEKKKLEKSHPSKTCTPIPMDH